MKQPQWMLYPVSEFEQWKAAWDGLNQACANGSLLLSSDFVTPCLKFFCNDRTTLAVARLDGEVMALTLVENLGLGRWQTLQPSQAPIGFWLCRPGAFDDTLLRSLAKSLPGWVLSISITQQDPALFLRPNTSNKLKTLDYITTGRLPIPADFEDYWAARGKNVRQNTNKARNRLAKEGISIDFDICREPTCIEARVKDYGDLESAGWKQATGTSVHYANEQGLFYIEMLKNFMPERGEVWRYLFNNEVVATDFCIRANGVLYILKTTYAEAWKKYSPAFMMHLEGVRYCSDNDIDAIEFYGPAMEWHKKLTDELRTMYHITWFSSPMVYQLKSALTRVKSKSETTSDNTC